MNTQESVRKRYSVRTYRKEPIADEAQAILQTRLAAIKTGPLGSTVRFELTAANEQDRSSLRGLGTYGFIKDPPGFIIGAVQAGDHALEDYGYAMEQAILEATTLELGTCWLGGSFTQSGFAAKISKQKHELIPAVTSIGYAAADSRANDRTRRTIQADRRLPWTELFFDGAFDKSLPPDSAGAYQQALEMVRLGPSASNKQPWRVIKAGDAWHFYCQRTPGYGKGSLIFTLLRLADLQRLDVGIAMCHFELTARELGLNGNWTVSDPGLISVDEQTLYIATWQPAN